MGPGAKHFHPASKQRILVEGPFSAVLLMAADASGGKLSLVEHPLAPRSLGSPMHTHSHEDEYSYILAGQIGAQVGAEVILAGPGDVIAKPSGIPHAFWNAGDTPARVLEIIAPGDSRTTSPGWASSSLRVAHQTRPHGKPWGSGSGLTSMSIPSPGSPPSTASDWTADLPSVSRLHPPRARRS